MTLFRIPVVPIGNGLTLPSFSHVKARDLFTTNPRGGFPQPRPPYRSSLTGPQPIGRAPTLDQDCGLLSNIEVNGSATHRSSTANTGELPLAGVRVLDFTAFLAGPFATQYLATAGADVIKVESVQRPDPMRYSTLASPDTEQWYELGNIFLSVNLNKRGITLNLADDRGRELALALAERCDVVIENYTPRVMEQFRLTYEDFKAVNPRIIMVRMPGFGLEGPWRDRPGFAASMEQVSGMAWVTGYPDGPPTIPGICDPVNGMHAVFAVLAALEHRTQTGEGQEVELSMLDMAANLVAEQVIEHSVYRHLMVRQGSRAPHAAPQGSYASNEPDQWVALSIPNDEQWRALCDALGESPLARDDRFRTASGRREFHDLIDVKLSAWFANQSVDRALGILRSAGVPAERVVHAYEVDLDPQMNARGFWEAVEHPVAGKLRYPGWPMQFSERIDPWYRHPAPLLGQHNEEVLCGELGLSSEDLATLRKANVVGDRPRGL
jgi:crotonobetainyl-CoA:carnitine CoA-transferase CaiB-like acyl-CoA transferase